MLPRSRRRDNTRKVTTHPGHELRLRLMIAISFLLCAFLVMEVRLISLGFVPAGEPDGTNIADQAPPVRGDIYDRNGMLLATTLHADSLYADPKLVLNVNEAVSKLSQVLPDLDKATLRDRLTRPVRFIWLMHDLTPDQVYKVNALGLPGLGFREEDARVYPQGALTAHVVGAVNYRNKGIAGVEAGDNDLLAGGKNVTLTLDMRLQKALRDNLVKAMDTSHAKAAWGISMDPRNGQVMALVSLPDYDPNHYGSATPAQWRNRVVGGVYEMGSTFKIFTLALALDSGKLQSLDTKFDCTHALHIDHYTIHDENGGRHSWLSAKEIFRYSSNIGASRIIDQFEPADQIAFFQKLGLLQSVNMAIPGEQSPLFPPAYRWKRIQKMTMSFGHGIAVSPVQMIRAVSAVVGDGVLRTPHVVMGQVEPPGTLVVKPGTVVKMRELLADVVANGTGHRARLAGYLVGGKTGTAEKSERGGYSTSLNLSSFVGVVPLESPRLVTLIMLDEAMGDNTGGGDVAAPAFKGYAKEATAILGIPPTSDMKDFASLAPPPRQIALKTPFEGPVYEALGDGGANAAQRY